MLSTTAVQVFSLTFDVLGQAAMLVLLGTLLFAKSLPQRNNPFLLNFFFTTLFTQLPPSLLFFSGHLGRQPPQWLCSTQAILMDGVSPMAGLAWVIVVLQTWIDLKATLYGRPPLGDNFPSIKPLLIVIPYIAFLSWCTASLAAALVLPAEWQLDHLVFCANESVFGVRVRQSIGFFFLGIGFVQFFLEILIARLMYRSWNTTLFPCPNFWSSLRVLLFCVAQLVPMLLSVVNSVLLPNYIPIKQITQMLVSMNALGTFLIFGTQKHILRAWKFWDPIIGPPEVKPPDVQVASRGSIMNLV